MSGKRKSETTTSTQTKQQMPFWTAVSGPNLLPELSLGDDTGWVVTPMEGALGDWSLETVNTPDGKAALRLTKRNGIGHLRLTTARAIRVPPGDRWTFRGLYRSEDAPISSLLLFRAPLEGQIEFYDSTLDLSAGWTSQSLMVNSPPGGWMDRVMSFKTGEETSVFPTVVLYGNPCTVLLTGLELCDRQYSESVPTGSIEPPLTVAEAKNIMSGRCAASARVEARNGQSAILVNAQPAAPVIYKGECYQTSGDYQGFGQAGVKFATVTVRLGSVKNELGADPNPAFWQGKAVYDPAAADEPITTALCRNPNALLILDVWVYPYVGWSNDNEKQCWQNIEGERGYGWWGNLEGFARDLETANLVNQNSHAYWWYPSYHSGVFRADVEEALKALVAHLKTQWYWKAVIGFVISGGHDLQFQTLFATDFSPIARQAFEEWCLKKYGSLAAISAAWGQPLADGSQIAIPRGGSAGDAPETTIPNLTGSSSSGSVDGAPAAPTPYLPLCSLVDYRDFVVETTWALRDRYACILKKSSGKSVITLAYGNPPSYWSNRFLKLRFLDGVASMSIYPYRNPGYDSAYHPENSFALHSKLFVQELDLRSWMGNWCGNEVDRAWIGSGTTLEAWRTIHRKLLGVTLAGGHGHWYFDMNGFFADEGILNEISATTKLASTVWDLEPRFQPMEKPPEHLPPPQNSAIPSFRPDVVVIRSSDEGIYLSDFFNPIVGAAAYQWMMLNTSGVPYDVHYLEDILAQKDLQRYKVYVFLQTTFISQSQRAEIERLLKTGNRMLIWVGDSGYVSEAGRSVESMSELVGMTVRTEEKYVRLTPLSMPSEAWSALERPLPLSTRPETSTSFLPPSEKILPFQGLSELYLRIMVERGNSSNTARHQPFWVEDTNATVLATYNEWTTTTQLPEAANAASSIMRSGLTPSAGLSKAATAFRRQPGWTSVFIGAPNGLGNDMLNFFARLANSYTCGAAGQSIHLNSHFLCIHGIKTETYAFRPPSGIGKITDLETEQQLARKSGVIRIPIEAQQTRWFLMD